MGETVPLWFSRALAEPADHASVESDGCPIAYRAWGRPGAPVVVLVHGGAAHAGWWDHVGPHLADGHRVVALDLSGHGDSGHREAYSLRTWAREVVAVAAAEGTSDPIVLGHSMGGFVTLTAAGLPDVRLRGAAAIDSPVRQMSPEARERMQGRAEVPANKVYPDRESAVRRFRPIPTDGSMLDYVLAHVAQQSVHEVDGGWTWKFDPRLFGRSMMEPEDLTRAACPVALLRGERGMAHRDLTADVAERLGGRVPVTVIPDAGHHIMLDQPVALIAVLQTLVGQWSIHD